jgi:hypothetical protein
MTNERKLTFTATLDDSNVVTLLVDMPNEISLEDLGELTTAVIETAIELHEAEVVKYFDNNNFKNN